MSTKPILAVVVVTTFLLAAPAYSAEKDVEKQNQQMWTGQKRESLGEVVKASDVLGGQVRNLQADKLGKVEEVAVDLESGRIIYLVLSSGGLLGIGDKSVILIPQSLHWDRADKIVQLDLSLDKVKTAPAFELSKWDEYSQSNQLVQIYHYYGRPPFFLRNYEEKRVKETMPALGYVARASKIIGMSVRNGADEKLGKVEDLILSLQRGRITHVIVSSGGFLGLGDELSAVPPAAFRYHKPDEFLRVNVTKADLTQAPHFKSSEWPNLADPAYAGSVYRAYRVEPYFDTDTKADNTGRNVRDREGNRLTPFDQGNSASDIGTTKNIRQQLMSKDNLSVNAKNVKIITAGGRVILRGPVNSEAEKQQVADIAATVVSADLVSNQLEVKREVN